MMMMIGKLHAGEQQSIQYTQRGGGGSSSGGSYRKNINISGAAEAIEALAHVVLNHVPVIKYCFRTKIVYITHIVRRVLRTDSARRQGLLR